MVRLAVLKIVPHDQVLSDHLKIVEAIRAGDEAAAEQAARRHVVAAREMLRQQIQDGSIELPWERAVSTPSPTGRGQG